MPIIKEMKFKVNSVIENLSDAGLPDGEPEISESVCDGFFKISEDSYLITYSENTEGGRVISDIEIDGEKIELTADDLLVSTESKEGFTAASDKGITVVMDTLVTEELLKEGNERELISKIQSMRKDAGFEVVDRINVNYVSDDAKVIEAINVVLADSVKEGQVDGFTKELDVNGAKCIVTINKVK